MRYDEREAHSHLVVELHEFILFELAKQLSGVGKSWHWSRFGLNLNFIFLHHVNNNMEDLNFSVPMADLSKMTCSCIITMPGNVQSPPVKPNG